MQQNVDGSFLYGELTTSDSIAQLKQALASAEESQLDIVYYKKDGQYFYFSFNTNSIGSHPSFPVHFRLDVTWRWIRKHWIRSSHHRIIPFDLYHTRAVFLVERRFETLH